MKNSIKLSVLVTFHNQKQYIKPALDNILNQKTTFPYEILIGLDGNDDDSLEVIQEYLNSHPNIRLYQIEQKNKSAYSIEKASFARLNLLQSAIGEYFCFLDGDDFYNDENRFQSLIEILEQNRDCIGCGHDYVEFDDKKQKFTKTQSLKIKEQKLDLKKYISKKYHLFSNTAIFRNIFYSQIPSDFPQNFLNDSTLTHYMLKYGKIYYLPKAMTAYRVNIESIFNSASYIEKKIAQLIAAEVNHQLVPEYEKLMCEKYKKLLLKCFCKNKCNASRSLRKLFTKFENLFYFQSTKKLCLKKV